MSLRFYLATKLYVFQVSIGVIMLLFICSALISLVSLLASTNLVLAHDVQQISDSIDRASKSAVSIYGFTSLKNKFDLKEKDRARKQTVVSELYEQTKEAMASVRRPESKPKVGAGFIVDATGHIVTAHDVVAGADKIIVSFSDGRQVEADSVVGFDRSTNIAVLLVKEAVGLKPILYAGTSTARLGQHVFAIGNPFGYAHSVFPGMVSKLDREVENFYESYTQISGSFTNGTLGAPIFNTDGELVGLTSILYLTSENATASIAFAMPQHTVKRIVDAILKHGSVVRGWMGVSIREAGEKKMVTISGVNKGSPAEKNGIKIGDVIRGFDKTPITTASSFVRMVGKAPPGTKVDIEILRNETQVDLSLILEERPDSPIGSDEK